jgi:hypothetical protein
MRSRVSKIIMESSYAERLLVAQPCPQVPAAIAKLHSFRTIQMYARQSRDRSRCSERLSEVDPADVSILILGGRCIDHGPAN